MRFTIDGYIELLEILRENDYNIADYQEFQKYKRCVILRHDVDFDLHRALSLAKIEYHYGVKSTYFILLTSNFYNIFSQRNKEIVNEIQDMGHTIGLHFDEMAYPQNAGIADKIEQDIRKELCVLSELFATDITVFSYHRPTKSILDANIKLQGIVNSYGTLFFKEFKYLSDSRMNWREPVLDIVREGFYPQLHILTHPFWYYEKEKHIREIISEFLNRAGMERYSELNDNFTNLKDVIEGRNIKT